MSNLRIGVPSKGRLAEGGRRAVERGRAQFSSPGAEPVRACREVPVDITFLRTEDIPVLCAEGAIDMGITGGDLVAESGAEAGAAARSGGRRMPAGGLRARG